MTERDSATGSSWPWVLVKDWCRARFQLTSAADRRSVKLRRRGREDNEARQGICGIVRGNNVVVPEGHPSAAEVSDLVQPTSKPSFESWLEHFDLASIPNRFLALLAKWAYPRYQRSKNARWESSPLTEIGRLTITWVVLRIVYISVIAQLNFETPPSTNQLIENAFTKSFERKERPEDTLERRSQGLDSTPDVSMPAQRALSHSADNEMEGTWVSGSPTELAEEFSEEQTHLFLRQLSSNVKAAADAAEKDSKVILTRENVLFRMFLVAAVTTFLFAAVGLALIFSGYLAVGVVSAAVAVLPGSGTAILRGMAKQLQEARAARVAVAEDDRRVWQAVQVARMIPDPVERNAAMADLSKSFARRISK
jgi:hypothetical protein